MRFLGINPIKNTTNWTHNIDLCSHIMLTVSKNHVTIPHKMIWGMIAWF